MFKLFLPEIFVGSVFDINLVKLKNEGVKAFIFDIDNTVATYAMPVPDERTAEWLGKVSGMGFKIFFVSNNSAKRVKAFAESVGIPWIGRAMKPCRIYLKRACGKMGVKPCDTALVGDQLFTDMWGGNRMGMRTILVNPISESEDKFVRLKRGVERKILRSAEKKNAKMKGREN